MGQSCTQCRPCTSQEIKIDGNDSPTSITAEKRLAQAEAAANDEEASNENRPQEPRSIHPSVADLIPLDAELQNTGLGHELSESAGLESRVRKLLRELRAREAAQLIEEDTKRETCEEAEAAKDGVGESSAAQEAASVEVVDAVKLQLRSLGEALGRLASHPGVATVGVAEAEPGAEQLLGVSVPCGPLPKMPVPTPSSTRSMGSAASNASKGSGTSRNSKKRDIVEVNIQLDELRRAEVAIEFNADGSISVDWSAFDLPVELPAVLCLVHEIDLIGELVPFIQDARLVNEFPWNEADRIIRIVSKPPIPGISAVEIVGQRFAYDLLDTPWEGLCLVESSPEWAGDPSTFRGVDRPASYPGAKQVDVRKLAALARPSGKHGELTTLIISTNATVKIPRALLPNWLLQWLIPKVAHMVYKQALERLKNIENTEHGRRLRGRSAPLYNHLRARIQEFVASKTDEATAAAGG